MAEDRLVPRTAEGFVDLDALDQLDGARLPNDDAVDRAVGLLRDVGVDDPSAGAWDDVLTHVFDPTSTLDVDAAVLVPSDADPGNDFVVGDRSTTDLDESADASADVEASVEPEAPVAAIDDDIDDDAGGQFAHFDDPGPMIELPDEPLEFERPADVDDLDDLDEFDDD